MSIENLNSSIDDHLDELRLEYDLPRDVLLQHTLHEQLQLVHQKLGNDAFQTALRRRLEEQMEVMDEVPVVKLNQLPTKWSGFVPNIPIEKPGVGQIFFRSTGAAEYEKATGWLCEWNGRRDLIVTNGHVVNNIADIIGPEPEELEVDDIGRIGIAFTPFADANADYLPTAKVHVDSGFDLAILQLASDAPEDLVGFQLAETAPVRDELVLAVGYPGRISASTDLDFVESKFPYPPNTRVGSPGRVKKVLSNTVMLNTCNLAPGSSGSPVLAENGRVSGVHYYGIRRRANYAVLASEVRRVLEEFEADA